MKCAFLAAGAKAAGSRCFLDFLNAVSNKEPYDRRVIHKLLLVIGMNFIPRRLAIGMTSSQWMEVGCPIEMRLWMNQWG